MSDGERGLELFLDLGAMVAREVRLDDLLGRVARRVADALGAERATVWLLDAATDQLRARVADHGPSLAPGRSVATAVAGSGEPVRSDDVGRDPRFAAELEQRPAVRVRSILCVPMAERAGAPLRGVLAVMNKQDGAFSPADQELLVALAEQLARQLE
jgi:GAF domain-containing protein